LSCCAFSMREESRYQETRGRSSSARRRGSRGNLSKQTNDCGYFLLILANSLTNDSAL
jgi:hypothetical protein